MKKSVTWMMFLAAAAWGPSNVSMAQDQPPAGGNNQSATGQGAEPGTGGGMMGGGFMGGLKDKLDLSDDQVSKLKDLLKGQQETMRPLRDQVRVDMDTLQQKVDAKAPDGDLKRLWMPWKPTKRTSRPPNKRWRTGSGES